MSIDQKLIDRINVLANKKKAEGLTEEELQEQAKLRQIYLQEFRKGFSQQLSSITVIDPEGNDVTPYKKKRIQH